MDDAPQPENEMLPQQQFMEQQRSIFDVPEPTPIQKMFDDMYEKSRTGLHVSGGDSTAMWWNGIEDRRMDANLNRAKD